MKSFSNQFFAIYRGHFRIFRWWMWMMFWIIAVLIPCAAEATSLENRNERDEIRNSSVSWSILYDAGWMSNGINTDKVGSQDGFQYLSPAVGLSSFNRPQSSENTERSTYNAANKTRSQCYNDFTIGHIFILLLACLVGVGIGLVVIETFMHLFVIGSDWWILNKIFK